MSEKESSNPELIAIAKIVKPKGLRGECVAEILTDFPERFENLDEVWLLQPNGKRRLKLENFGFQNQRIVLKFESVDSMDDAEAIRGAEVCIDDSEAVELEDDEFYDWDLEGCLVEDSNHGEIGVVTGVFRAGENINLIVKGDKKEHMIPFVSAICVEVDTEGKRITTELPEGLLDF
ncbi:MAG: ribosome maturation factor RimM [Pyrinomonadaceae bacterium]